MMRKIWAIIWKDTLVRFISPVEWLFFLILPVVFTLIIGSSSGPSSDTRVKLFVVDEANSPLSAALTEQLGKSTSVRVVPAAREKALADFDQRKVAAVLILPADFDLSAVQQNRAEIQIYQQPNSIDAMIAQQAVQAVLSRVSSAVDIANTSLSEAKKITSFPTFNLEQAFFDQSLASAQKLINEAPVRLIETKAQTKDPIQYDPRTNSSVGQMITWVFIPLVGLSAMFAYERQKGTLRRLLTTPTRKATYLGGTIIGQVLTALVQLIILILFGIFVMKLNRGNSPLAIATMLIPFTLMAAALGTMLGTMVKTEGQANGLSIMIGMVMAMMSGCWYPIELFPQAVRLASKILPLNWAMQGMLDITLRGQGFAGVWPEALVLLGFALVFFSIGIWRFKYE
jgi:ABC-2 type transport system permease protein